MKTLTLKMVTSGKNALYMTEDGQFTISRDEHQSGDRSARRRVTWWNVTNRSKLLAGDWQNATVNECCTSRLEEAARRLGKKLGVEIVITRAK